MFSRDVCLDLFYRSSFFFSWNINHGSYTDNEVSCLENPNNFMLWGSFILIFIGYGQRFLPARNSITRWNLASVRADWDATGKEQIQTSSRGAHLYLLIESFLVAAQLFCIHLQETPERKNVGKVTILLICCIIVWCLFFLYGLGSYYIIISGKIAWGWHL